MKEIKLAYPPAGPNVFKRMLDRVPSGEPGEVFKVFDKRGEFFGYAFYNPKSNIVLRIFSREARERFGIKEFLSEKLSRAAELRRTLALPREDTNAYRLVHDYGDGLPGLTVDVYNKEIVAEFYSIGFFRLREELKAVLLSLYPGFSVHFRASSYTQKMEGFALEDEIEHKKTRVKENGAVFEVNLSSGYKTGFFCDQRENRLYFSRFAAGKSVLDICSYTGGFGIYAKKLGGAEEVTCVELDPEADEQAKRNANLNSVRINNICADAFTYMRQMLALDRRYGLVALDPHKLITSRDEKAEGVIKYKDFNKLALHLVEEGGLFATCSCSGLLSMEEFSEVLRYAASVSRRKVQIFKRSGAGEDHPFTANYMEGEYLKTIWAKVF